MSSIERATADDAGRARVLAVDDDSPFLSLLRDVVRAMNAAAPGLAGYQIEMKTDPSRPEISADPAAFAQAGRNIPAIATEDANLLACDWQKRKGTSGAYKLFTVSSQNAMSRLAVDVAVAKATGGVVLELRATDRIGLLHRVASALEERGVDVRWARVATLGASVVDAFGLASPTEPDDVPSAARRREIEGAVLAAAR